MERAKRKILHIDDDEHILAAVKRSLEYAGYEVASSTGPFVGHLIERERPDLIVVDVEMPFISGEKLFRIVKSHTEYAHLPIVFFSGRPVELVSGLLDAGEKVVFVSKDDGVHKLVEAIDSALG
jgi:DNA-binding response OmpR family regulator